MTFEAKRSLCEKCFKAHCINRGNEKIANEEQTCYEQTKCWMCPGERFCQSKNKDNLRATDNFSMKECFVPIASCRECCMQSGCQNKDFGIPFELNSGNPCRPQCFSARESTR